MLPLQFICFPIPSGSDIQQAMGICQASINAGFADLNFEYKGMCVITDVPPANIATVRPAWWNTIVITLQAKDQKSMEGLAKLQTAVQEDGKSRLLKPA